MANGTAPTLEIWWPSNGANVSGVQPFKARLGSWALGSYQMYWQVDGGQLNRMGDSYVGGPHKESAVNVSAFTWKGAGPYRITFVARDLRGGTQETQMFYFLGGMGTSRSLRISTRTTSQAVLPDSSSG